MLGVGDFVRHAWCEGLCEALAAGGTHQEAFLAYAVCMANAEVWEHAPK